jgi:hypothetical protein
MNKQILTIHGATQFTAETRRSLLACGLWMRAAFVGASATAIGVIQLFEGEWSVLAALLTVAGGIALTLLSWRRVKGALSDEDEPATASGPTPAAAHR